MGVGAAVGEGVAVGVDVTVGVGEEVGVGEAVGEGEAAAVGVAVPTGEGVAATVGVGGTVGEGVAIADTGVAALRVGPGSPPPEQPARIRPRTASAAARRTTFTIPSPQPTRWVRGRTGPGQGRNDRCASVRPPAPAYGRTPGRDFGPSASSCGSTR